MRMLVYAYYVSCLYFLAESMFSEHPHPIVFEGVLLTSPDLIRLCSTGGYPVMFSGGPTRTYRCGVALTAYNRRLHVMLLYVYTCHTAYLYVHLCHVVCFL